MNKLLQNAQVALSAYALSVDAKEPDIVRAMTALKRLRKSRNIDILKDLFARVEALGVKMADVMLKAEVNPGIIHHWRSSPTPQTLVVWKNMLDDYGVGVPLPGQSTYSFLGKHAREAFRDAGYSEQQLNKVWRHRDAIVVENYKKVLHKVVELEKQVI